MLAYRAQSQPRPPRPLPCPASEAVGAQKRSRGPQGSASRAAPALRLRALPGLGEAGAEQLAELVGLDSRLLERVAVAQRHGVVAERLAVDRHAPWRPDLVLAAVAPADLAAVKRAIDKLNQQRNDLIERLDDALIEQLSAAAVQPRSDARLNTETPGSTIDRLSIMSLRVYHLAEHLDRADVDEDHLDNVRGRLARCRVQQRDLSQALVELLDDLLAGRKILKVYRQMKMYNDPTLNPYLYKGATQAA